jgi:quinol monooxygenase YgiN
MEQKMSYALFIQHKTLPGKRDDVQRVWQKHMMPAIAINDGHTAYFYSFGADPDSICAFQVYRDQEAAGAFLKKPEYAAYLEEVEPLLMGDPVVTVLDVQWSKPAAQSA